MNTERMPVLTKIIDLLPTLPPPSPETAEAIREAAIRRDIISLGLENAKAAATLRDGRDRRSRKERAEMRPRIEAALAGLFPEDEGPRRE